MPKTHNRRLNPRGNKANAAPEGSPPIPENITMSREQFEQLRDALLAVDVVVTAADA